MANLTVSVVIATYNHGRFLAGAIESVFAQTFDDYEIIVVDDGSSDHTPEVIQPYLDDPRVRYHRVDHLGHPKAKNYGLRQTTGRFVAFLDADDQWLPAKLERQIARFAADPELGVVYSRYLVIDQHGEVIPTRAKPLYRGTVIEPLLLENFVCFSSAMISREVFEQVGSFDETLGPCIDYDLWLRIGLRYRFDYVDEPLVQYRNHEDSMTGTMTKLSRRPEVDRIMQRFLEDYGGRSRVRPQTLRLCKAVRSCNIASWFCDDEPFHALRWYLHSILFAPAYGPAWFGLARTLIPERVRRWLRGVRRGRQSRVA